MWGLPDYGNLTFVPQQQPRNFVEHYALDFHATDAQKVLFLWWAGGDMWYLSKPEVLSFRRCLSVSCLPIISCICSISISSDTSSLHLTHQAPAMAFRPKSCLCPSCRALTFAAIDAAQTCLLEDFVKAAMYGGAIVGMLVMGSIGSTLGRDTVAAACAPFCLIFWSSRVTGVFVCGSLRWCNWAS